MSDGFTANAAAFGPIMQSVLDAVIGINAAGIVTAWSSVAERTFGWSVGEAVDQPLAVLIIPPQYRAAHHAGMRRFQETGDARVLGRRIEITAAHKDGHEFPVELAIVATPDLAGTEFVAFLRDISDRRDEQEKLRLSEESLRLTTEAAEIGTWDLNLDTDMLTWSPRTKAMFGFSPDVACTMKDFYAGLHPDDLELTSQAFSSAIDPDLRATYDVQYRTIGKEDGVVRWVAAKGRGIFNEAGRCVRAVGTAIDITARRLADERHALMLQLSDVLRGADPDIALNDACALMGSYFGVSRVGYGQLDPAEDIFDYVICWTDGSVPPLLGRFPAVAFGKKIVAKLNAGETVVVSNLLADRLSDEPETRQTATSVGTRAILVVPFLRAGRLRTIVYLNDHHVRTWTPEQIDFMEEMAERTRQVIARSEAEAALQALNATLEARIEERTRELRTTEDVLRQSQKMEAIGQLTGGIAHDFNNLLQGITGSLDIIQRRLDQGRTDDLARFINGATVSAQRAAALTHRLLAFARRQPLDTRAVELNPLITSMEDLLRRTLGERIALALSFVEGLWLTRCDPNQLENAVLNLAINARDAMPDGGCLSIRTYNHNVTAPGNPETGVQPGEYVCVLVEDTGVGMDAETMARVFEPFFTTKPTGKGTGLGLSMIYGFIRQSEGHVTIDSQIGQGTRIMLCLPRYDGEAARIASDQSAPLEGKTGETVLVVEDEPIVRSLIVDVLDELGYIAIEAADGPSALEMLQSSQHIDLLITDIGLPGLNGRQLADAARVGRPDLKIMLMTGYAENVTSPQGILDTRMMLVTKPFDMNSLAARIRSLVDDGP